MPLALAVAGLAVGCSSQRGLESYNRLELQQLLRNRGVTPQRLVVPYRLTAEMKGWVKDTIPTQGDPQERLQRLADALFSKKDLHLEYERNFTGTAEEVFETGRANCLAFTHLFVGLAREVDLPVFFLEVSDVENYRREGDLIVVSDHVAIGYGPPREMHIIDFARDPTGEYRQVRVIDDLRAIAMFHSNRGAEHLRGGANSEALEWLRTAVALDPMFAASWINIGVALRRVGDFESAEASYRQALELDLGSTSALQNLSALLSFRGEEQEAIDLLALADRAANRNPYTYLTLGDLSMRHGKMEAAGRFYRKAMKRRNDDPEPLAAMGLWELHQGEARKARRYLRRAEEIDPQAERVSSLRARLGVYEKTSS